MDGIHVAFEGKISEPDGLKFTASGTACLSFGVCTVDKKGTPTWVRCTVWKDRAAMLAGLLVDLLAPRRRWEMYRRALSKHPYCSAHYPVTGNRKIDEALSRILNRAWRGDEGGALLMANANRGEQTVYEDPLELLQDVQSVLTLPIGGQVQGYADPRDMLMDISKALGRSRVQNDTG